jgi:hypothetical protein
MAAVLTVSAAATVVLGAGSAPADTGAACTASYSIQWQTPSNSPPDFGVVVTVTNTSTYPLTGWSASWDWNQGQKLIDGSAYSADVAQSGTHVVATPQGFNAALKVGASTSWGFHATFDGTDNPIPTVTCSGPSQGSASATLGGTLDPLGVNTASWDTDFTDPAIASYLTNANVGLVRYPGGSYADDYNWQTNKHGTDTDPVDFADYSRQVDAITGGQKFVTVNYGSDTADSAGAWAKQAAATSGQSTSLWEIGNEEYGSWETDNHAGAHTAASYASNATAYEKAIKSADPKAQVCYDYAMDGTLAPGSGVDGFQNWNDTFLKANAATTDCADVHWYPVNGTPDETPQSIMETIDNIPAAAAEVKSTLQSDDPDDYFVVGETNISQTANEWNEEPVGALFAASNTLEWLANGAQSVDWWDVHNYGSQDADFGMFSSGSNDEPAVNTPYAPYYGYALASKLAVKGAKVGTLPISTAGVYSYYSQLPSGGYAVLLANADPSKAATVSTSSIGVSGSATTSTWSGASPTITSGTLSGSSVSVPAQGIVVVSTGSGTPPTTGGTTSGGTTTGGTTTGGTTTGGTTTGGTTTSGTTGTTTSGTTGSTTGSTTSGTTTSGTTTSGTTGSTTSGTTTTGGTTTSGSTSGSTTGSTTSGTTTSGTTGSTTSGTTSTGGTTTGGTGSGASCKATWSVTGSWSGGFQLGFTVQNTGTTATHDWTVGWSWPGTQGIASDWNATFSTSGQSVSAASLSYNGALAAGGNTTFGLVGTGGAPTSLTGLTCKAD